MSLAAGTRVGPYEVLSLIGAGGMGEVYLAEDVRLRRQVALKRLLTSSGDAPHPSERLLNEARAVATLNHPNIAAVHDVFEGQDSAFIVMEYAPGEPLASVIRRGPLAARRVIEIGLQLSDALIAAHAAGILHRDLKPSNIHLTPAGNIKVLDFGIARIAPHREQDDSELRTHTATVGPLAGTPGYIAPEQVAGQPPDERGDIYAAGIILFQLATGRQPFEAADPLDRLLSTIGKKPPRAHDVHASVPLPLSDVIGIALASRPTERFQSAIQLKSALEDASAAIRTGCHSGEVTPDVTVKAAKRTIPPRRRIVLATALAAVVLAVIGIFAPRTIPLAPQSAESGSGHATIAVLPPQNRTGQPHIDEWPPLIQSLLASELTGVPDLAVMDVLAVNDLLEPRPRGSSGSRNPLSLLRRANVTIALKGELLSAEHGYRIGVGVVDSATGESQFSTRVDVTNEQALPAAATALATQVLAFLQVRVLQARDKDLRPWISFREQNIEAVKAFVLANQYVYERQPAESEKYLRRAMELDPSFIAPRLWLVPRLINEGKTQEAQDIYKSLLALESRASPFEQSLIDYIRASLQRDVPAQSRALESALAYSPGNNILLVILADLRLAAGDCVAARAAMQPAVEIGWRYPLLYPLWAWCSAETGDWDDAVHGIDRTIELSGTSDEPDVYGLLEAVAIAAGDSTRAANCGDIYERRKSEIGKPSPSADMVLVYGRLGESCLRLKRYSEAAVLYRRALAAKPDIAAFRDNLGTALEALGDPDGARKEYKRAIAIDPGVTHARERSAALANERRSKGDR